MCLHFEDKTAALLNGFKCYAVRIADVPENYHASMWVVGAFLFLRDNISVCSAAVYTDFMDQEDADTVMKLMRVNHPNVTCKLVTFLGLP